MRWIGDEGILGGDEGGVVFRCDSSEKMFISGWGELEDVPSCGFSPSLL